MTASREGLRFLLFGAFNTAVTYAAYCLLVTVLPAQVAYALVFVAGIALAWFGNSRFVFGKPQGAHKALAYPFFYLAQYALTAALIHVLMQWLGCGPRLALGVALVVTVPLSFLWNRRLLAGPRNGDRALWLAWGIGALVLGVHAMGFAGFWQGDDVANLFIIHQAAEQGRLIAFVTDQFLNQVPSAGAFYRPLMMTSLVVNYALDGATYASWYALNLVVHAACTLVLYFLLREISRREGLGDSPRAMWIPALAALSFGLSPVVAEGVYWVSARSDGWVTIGALIVTACFLFGDRWPRASIAAGTLAMLVALGFKESAVLLPGVLVLLWMADGRECSIQRKALLVVSAILAAALLAWRAWLFGQIWNVYLPGNATQAGMIDKLLAGVASLLPWWQGLSQGATVVAGIGLAMFFGSWIAALAFARDRPLRLSLAFAIAAIGTTAVTLANLGALSDQGEGGRLFHTVMAWGALSAGSALLSARFANGLVSRICAASLCLAILASGLALAAQWSKVHREREHLAATVDQLNAWAERHSGQTLLIVPDHVGHVVLGRNAQGGLVLPPIQSAPLLHRVVPTLPTEITERGKQFCNGLGTQLDRMGAKSPDGERLRQLLQPAPASAPAWVACWNRSRRDIVVLHQTLAGEACDAFVAAARLRMAECE
jgi:putative flippase GtrA